MIGCLQTHVLKQPIIALYFESETVLKFYNLQARTFFDHHAFKRPHIQPTQPSFQSGSDISERKQIMIDVQNSVKNMKGRFTQFENSLKEVKETSDRLIVSNNKISEEVNCLSKKVTK